MHIIHTDQQNAPTRFKQLQHALRVLCAHLFRQCH
ncbi:Uncharacterised protein [Vibrio cholerae]|nr:Uncharacterised protein [Vibrio cholerae]CSC93511.1 Uncharacterised protein [Vibrio cholerae]CSI59666.1 Uncharacterised protein [Vibrio cholerae]